MPSTVFDSAIFRDMFGTPAMRAVFSDEALTGRYVETEVALAKAQGKTGVIPREAAATIAAKATNQGLDLARLKRESDIVGYPILPIVRQIAEQCGDAGKFVHWGATTQDIMDTATVLQVRAALDLVATDLDGVRAALVVLTRQASRYADGWPHASAAGAADHVRPQDGDLAVNARPACRAPCPAAAARRASAVRRGGWHVGLAWHEGA